MAKALAYNRATQKVVTIDTVNNRVDDLGSAVATAETTNAFPGRTSNIIATFQGKTFLLYLDNAGAVRLAALVAGAWVDVVGFTPITAASGTLTPFFLHADQTKLVAFAHLSGSVGVDGERFSTSTDGVTWTAPAAFNAASQPASSEGGHSIVWRNTIFFATAQGIGWYRPQAGGAFLYDPGSDSGLIDAGTPLGHFAHWDGSLYFAKFAAIPVLYRLDDSWDPASPVSSPAWTKVATTGIPSVGIVTVGPDSNTLLLFVNKAGKLCILYGGQLGSKLVQTTQAAYPAFTDVTTTFLPTPFPSTADLGFSLFIDDRRRANELQSIMVRDLTGNMMTLLGWDGVQPIDTRANFSGTQLMCPDGRFGEQRISISGLPSCDMTAVSQPSQGRTLITYLVFDASSRSVDVFGEYSVDGDEWLPMTQGDGDSGHEQLTSSPTGTSHTFMWDTFVDLDGNYPFMFMRISARISSA